MRSVLIFLSTGVLCLAFSSAAFAVTPTKEAAAKGEILTKLNEIAKTQQQILAQLDDVKKELYVVKIRASRN